MKRWLLSFPVKVSITLILTALTGAIFWIVNDVTDTTDSVVISGGVLGSIASGIVILGNYFDSENEKPIERDFLFWRALSDLGVGLRFAFTRQLNQYFFDTVTLNVSTTNQSSCPFPTAFLELFLLAAQFWVLVMALDLVRSLTYPFSNASRWGKIYLVSVWAVSLVFALVCALDHTIYGFFYVDATVDSTGICFIGFHKSRSAFNINALFYFPLLLCFGGGIFAIIYTFYRLKNGIPSTLIPRIQAANANTVNIITYLIFTLCLLIPLTLAFFGIESTNVVSIRLTWYLLGAQGVSAMLVWLISTNAVDLGASLRQDILTYATKGIRSCVTIEDNRAPANDITIYIQADVEPKIGNIDLWFFLKFIFGDEEEMLKLVKMQIAYRNSRMTLMGSLGVSTLRESDIENLSLVSASSFNETDAERLSKLLVYNTAAPSDASAVCCFQEIKPMQFQRIRRASDLSNKIYRAQFAATIKEKVTRGGASGAFFFFSKDDQYIAKSCSKAEFQLLIANVEKFADYFESADGQNSFIAKIYGAYTVSLYGIKLYFFVMANLLHGKDQNGNLIEFEERYDLKGSTVNRSVQYPNDGDTCTCKGCKKKFIYVKERAVSHLSGIPIRTNIFDVCSCTVSGRHEPNLLCKDNDLKYKLRLHEASAKAVVSQLEKDAWLLSKLGIMDYSLLLGVHHQEFDIEPALPSAEGAQQDGLRSRRSLSSSRLPHPTNSTESSVSNLDARAELVSKRFEASSIVGADFYQFGIIDYLQDWDWAKVRERFIKVQIMGESSYGLSAIPPPIYRDRFLSHIRSLFGAEAAPPAVIEAMNSNSEF